MTLGALLAATLVAAPARADLDFVQVTQAQTSAGAEGLFGKTWVELRGGRMRLVSGYARKLEKNGKKAPDPRRRVQILDVKEGTKTAVDPTKKAYAVGALAAPEYGHGLEGALGRGQAARRIVRHEVKLEKAGGTRKLLGADCERWRVTVILRLAALNGREEAARMDQNLWVAPLAGDLAKNLMELIAFENAYRAAVKSPLSPLDHERYQVREAAAYLQVPEAQLLEVVGAVRAKLRELPSYPVSSSVAWWRDEGRAVRAPEPKRPAVRPDRPAPEPGVSLGQVRPRAPAPLKPRLVTGRKKPFFRVIDWRREERRIDGMMERTRSEFGDFPLGPLGETAPGGSGGGEPPPRRRAVPAREVAPRFEEELRRILDELMAAEAALEEAAEQVAMTSAPFFEVFAELHGLEVQASVADSHFALPPSYKRVPALD